jgi:membrane protease YdiL (CAAX protease family)
MPGSGPTGWTGSVTGMLEQAPSTPAPVRRLRWGIGDVLIAWFAGVVGSTIVVLPFLADDVNDVSMWALLLGVVGQAAVTVGVVAWTARHKGRGSLRADFGFEVKLADWWWFLVGAGVQLAAAAVVLPLSELYGQRADQEIVDRARQASGMPLVLFALAVVILAPLTEELLFRGVLLRSLLRRTTPAWAIFITAAVFGAVHPLLDPGSIGSVIALPAITGIGFLASYQAWRTSSLSRPMLLHAGFNVVTAVTLVVEYVKR